MKVENRLLGNTKQTFREHQTIYETWTTEDNDVQGHFFHFLFFIYFFYFFIFYLRDG